VIGEQPFAGGCMCCEMVPDAVKHKLYNGTWDAFPGEISVVC